MARKIVRALMVLVILASLGAMMYPFVSDWWNAKRQEQLLSSYESYISTFTAEDFSAEWAKAQAYNDRITENNIYGDVFSGRTSGGSGLNMNSNEYSYNEILNIAGDGVMGYIEIPKISIKIPICHGVGDDVLQDSAGHMPGTKLPIGGQGNNAVLAAHRGLPSYRLFTDLDQLGAGDVLYLHILDEVLAYRVEKVWAMVDKYDTATMEDAMSIVPGGDHVSLFTCTPYGVNSHRMIVRAERFYPSGGDDELMAIVSGDGMLRLVAGQSTMALAAGFAAILTFFSLWTLQGYMMRLRRIRRDERSNQLIRRPAGKSGDSGKAV